jgi:hypothetical protein
MTPLIGEMNVDARQKFVKIITSFLFEPNGAGVYNYSDDCFKTLLSDQ